MSQLDNVTTNANGGLGLWTPYRKLSLDVILISALKRKNLNNKLILFEMIFILQKCEVRSPSGTCVQPWSLSDKKSASWCTFPDIPIGMSDMSECRTLVLFPGYNSLDMYVWLRKRKIV